MSGTRETARVVIIGGGVVGVSALYHLALAGWTDCVLCEKNELTAGSTWHAAGNIPTFSGSLAVMRMQAYSTALYRELAERVDYPMNYHVTGSVRLGHTCERRMEFEHVAAQARAMGLHHEVGGSEMLDRHHPFVGHHDLSGVLYDPDDGDIDPAQLTQALAKGARDLGAKIHRFRDVTGVRRENDEWIVETAKGEIAAEFVVNAAGYQAAKVAAWFPRSAPLPMAVMSHQYVLFDEIDEVAAWARENGGKLPIVRDVDSSYYLRQEKGGMNLGPYERNCRAHWTGSLPGGDGEDVPDDFSFQLWEDDLERIEWYLEDACERMPLLGTAGLQKVINGPIPYAPDGHPLIGPMPGVPNAFEACVFTFGICQAGGAGKVLAEWIVEGRTEHDMWAVDPRRFTAHTADPAYALAKAEEVYGHEYAIHFPHHHWPAGRPGKLSPVHDRLGEQGAVFGAFNGWERAVWFAKDGDDTSERATETYERSGPWEPRVRAECEAVRDRAGILDLCGFSRYAVRGAGAREALSRLATGAVPSPGRVGLLYVADDRGRLVTELSCLALGEDEFELIGAATAQWHDYELLRGGLPASVDVVDETEARSCLLVTGPKSRAILSACAKADLERGWLTHQDASIAGRALRLARVSFAGELGWEVHANAADVDAIHEAILEAGEPHGLAPFGMHALDSMRLEKGYRAWRSEISPDYTVLECGLDRFVRWSKPEFRGRRALEAERQTGPRRRLASLRVEANGADAPGFAPVWSEDQIVGEVTSGGYGYRTDQSIALAMLRADVAEDAPLAIEMFGERRRAVVQPDLSIYDASNERPRA